MSATSRENLRIKALPSLPEATPGDRYREPGTIILVLILAQPVLQAITGWLLKRRKKKAVRIRTRMHYSDGTEVARDIDIDLNESELSSRAVIRQLVYGLGLPGELLKETQQGFER